jgi:hypothetical protein
MAASFSKLQHGGTRKHSHYHPSSRTNPVVVAPVTVTVEAERDVATELAGPLVVTMTGVFVKLTGYV